MNRGHNRDGILLASSVQWLSHVWLRPHESQHARPPCPSQNPRVYPNSCPSSRWCHPAISSSVVPFSSCPQSLPASGSFPTSQLFAWGGQSTGVSASASVLAMNTQDLSPQPISVKGDLKKRGEMKEAVEVESLSWGIQEAEHGTKEDYFQALKSSGICLARF